MNWKFWKKKEAPKAPITEAAVAVAEAVAVSAPVTVEVAVTAPPNVTVTVEPPQIEPPQVEYDQAEVDKIIKKANKDAYIEPERSLPTDYAKMKIAKPKTKKKGNHVVTMVKPEPEPVPENVETWIERMNQQAEKLRLERKAEKKRAKKKKEA